VLAGSVDETYLLLPCHFALSLTTNALFTNAVVATRVELSDISAVVAVGAPVNCGSASGAFTFAKRFSVVC
jgi:hypothetical protein